MKIRLDIVHIFIVKQEGEVFWASCFTLIENYIRGESKEKLEESIEYTVRNICMRNSIKKLIYFIQY